MGTLLRHGSEEQKRAVAAARSPSGELRLQAFGVTEPDAGSDTTQIQTRAVRHGDGYVVNGQKIWTSRAEHSDLMLLLARTTPLEQRREADRRPLGVHRRPARSRGRHGADQPDQDDDEPRDDRGLLRRPRAARRRADRRGGRGLPLHPRRDERRADPDRRGVHRRRPLVHRARRRLRERARRLRPADRREPGRAVPARAGAHGDRPPRT